MKEVFVVFVEVAVVWDFLSVIEAYLSVVVPVKYLTEQKGNHQYALVEPPG